MPCCAVSIINFIFFDLACTLGNNLWVKITLVQFAGRVLSFALLTYSIALRDIANFNRFVPLIYKKCFNLFWSLIFWFFNTFTRHWFIRAILSWQNKWHFISLFQNIKIGTSSSDCGFSRSYHWLHARPVLVWNTSMLFLIADDPLRFRRFYFLLTI